MTDQRIIDILLRTRLLRPYLGTALATVTPVEKPGLGTVAVDASWRLYYDIEWLMSLTPREQCAVIEHEVWHLLRNHHARAAAINAERLPWNLAGDAEINDDLEGLPKGHILPKSFGAQPNDLAESYYRDIMAQAKPMRAKHCGGGSGAGAPNDDELPGDDAGAPGIPEVVGNRVRQATAEAIREQAKSSPPGTVPAGMVVWADQQLAPVHRDWREVLSATVAARAREMSRGREDYSWARVSRRSLRAAATGIREPLRPGMQRPHPRVAIVADTSGSMYSDRAALALGVVEDLLRRLGPTTVMAGDTVTSTKERARRSVRQVTWRGGGGTDMTVLLADAARDHDIVVLVSDCETPWPSVKPPAHVVIVRVGDGDWPKWECAKVDVR